MTRGVSALARYIHPEFGGFCLTTRFRRDIRVIAVSVLIGTTVGAVGAAIVGLNASPSPASAGAATALAIPEAGLKAAEGSRARVEDAQNGTNKAGSASGGGSAPSLAAEASPHPKAACRGATPGTEQGCSFFQPRRVRVRALTDAPEMARVAVGRVTAPSVAIENSAAKLSVAKPTEENSASVAARAEPPTDQALSGRPVAKKLQKTARRARRNDRWIDPAPRDRADPWFARAEDNAGAARRPYAREASSARRGFWDWSW